MATGIALDLATKRLLTWTAPAALSGMVTDLLTDTIYHAVDDEVLPQFQGAPVTGIWRSKRIVLDNWPSFGWLRLEGPFTSAVVRIYVEGVLWFTSPAITDVEPIRLPAGRAREWEIELESAGQITDLVLATSAQELRQA